MPNPSVTINLAGLGHDCPQCRHKMIDHYDLEQIAVAPRGARPTTTVYTWCCDGDCPCETVRTRVAA